MDSVNVTRFFTVCVPTLGNPRIQAYLQLPPAYRSLSRPSSAPDAKAFPLRSFQLNQLLLVSRSLASCELCRLISVHSSSKLLPFFIFHNFLNQNFLLLPCLSSLSFVQFSMYIPLLPFGNKLQCFTPFLMSNTQACFHLA